MGFNCKSCRFINQEPSWHKIVSNNVLAIINECFVIFSNVQIKIIYQLQSFCQQLFPTSIFITRWLHSKCDHMASPGGQRVSWTASRKYALCWPGNLNGPRRSLYHSGIRQSGQLTHTTSRCHWIPHSAYTFAGKLAMILGYVMDLWNTLSHCMNHLGF